MDRKQEIAENQNAKASATPLFQSNSKDTVNSINPPAQNIQADSTNNEREEQNDLENKEKEGSDKGVFDILPPLPPFIKNRTRAAADRNIGKRNLIPFQLKLPFPTKIDKVVTTIKEKYTLNSKH